MKKFSQMLDTGGLEDDVYKMAFKRLIQDTNALLGFEAASILPITHTNVQALREAYGMRPDEKDFGYGKL